MTLFELSSPKPLVREELFEETLHMLYAPSGAGKSFVALDEYALPVAQEHTVLYCASEGFLGYADRIKAWCNQHHLEPGKLRFSRDIPSLMDDDAVTTFINEVKQSGNIPKLIIFDTFVSCLLGGSENSNDDMQKVMNNARRIIAALKCAILLVHHTGKHSFMERGASALRAAVEILMQLENRDGTLVLKCAKSRDTEGFPTRYMKLMVTDARPGRKSCVVMPADSILAAKDDNLSKHQQAILEFLELPSFHDIGATSRTIKQEIGDEIGNLYNVLGNLMKRGYIKRNAKGEPYTITEAGLQALKTAKGGKNDY